MCSSDLASSGCDGVRVALDPDSVACTLVVDRRRFDRMVANLLDNARRYGARSIAVRAGRRARTVEIHVDDDGPGVPTDEHEVIFDRFTRGSTAGPRPGTGLGLALVREHAKLHGGTVSVGSSPEGGARFTITLPREWP